GMEAGACEGLHWALLKVLVGSMHRLLALEPDHPPPSELTEPRPGVRRIQPIRLEAAKRRPRDQVDSAREQHVAALKLIRGPGMARIICAVNAPRLPPPPGPEPLLALR